MHMGHSHSAIVDSYPCYPDMHKKICTLINLHVMQLRLLLGIALNIVKAVGLTSCWYICR